MDDNTPDEAAVILAGWSLTTARLLAAHVAGPDGRCRTCTTSNGGAQRWPCLLALLAESATALRTQTFAASRLRPDTGSRAPTVLRRP